MSTFTSCAESAIHVLFSTYQSILNTSDLPAAIALYSPDGVCMFPQSLPHVGTAAITVAYTELFGLVDHFVEVKVEDVTVLNGDEDAMWAFARTTTRGKVRYRDGGREERDAVWQAWVLRRESGEDKGWRVLRYSFAPMGEGA